MVLKAQLSIERKLTFLDTLPSSMRGWPPFNHPGLRVPQCFQEIHLVGITLPAAPRNRNHPGPNLLSHSRSSFDVALYFVFLVLDVRDL